MIINQRILISMFTLLACGLLFGLVKSGFFFGSDTHSQVTDSQQLAESSLTQLLKINDRSIITLRVGEQLLQTEVVNTSESITLGLSERTEIGHDGMLFVMPFRQTTSFWMKDMQFDLDLIWIADGKIVGITPAVPAPNSSTPLSQLPKYASPTAVTEVLEVPAGTAQLHGWQTGSLVEFLPTY